MHANIPPMLAATNLIRDSKVPKMHRRWPGSLLANLFRGSTLLLLFFFSGLAVGVSGEPVISSVVSPADGELHDEVRPISWSSVPDAESFSLWVGSSPGANDLYQSGET